MKSMIPQETIEHMISMIRGHKVMLDSDLAILYGVTTFNLNKAVKRNLSRFPEDFMFQLNIEYRRIQVFEIPNWNIKERSWWQTIFAICLY